MIKNTSYSSLVLLVALSLCINSLFAQIGAHSDTISWQQIKVNNHTIVFPKQFEQQAFRAGNIFEYMDAHATRSIGNKTYPLQLLIHNQTTVPNGFVGVAPYRSEFFATPPVSPNTLGTVDWLDALSIHEYRHAQQYANSRVGISKLAHYLMGDNGWGLALSLLPNWFWEGDAVFMETALSSQGRGRMPYFSRLQRSLLLNNLSYTYEKARNGSFKDLVPNQYPLGYIMTSYARQQFGHDIWNKIFSDAASYKNIFYTFSTSLKKNTGLNTRQLYAQSYEFSKEKWQKEQLARGLAPTNRISPSSLKTVTNYYFPFYIEDESLVYLKNSFQKTMGLYQLKEGVEKQLTTVGFTLDEYLSVTNNKAIWVEFERNPRRFEQNFSVLVSFDLVTREKIRLTKKTRLFTPAYSQDGKKIIAVHITPEQQNQLVILNGQTGKYLDTIPNPKNHFLIFPKWMPQDEGIIFIAKKNSQLALFKYLFNSQSTVQLSNWTHHVISDLFLQDDRIYFTASFDGADNIYSIASQSVLATEDKASFSPTLLQHSQVAIGAYSPSIHPDKKSLVFTQFDHKGFYLSNVELSTISKRQGSLPTFQEPAAQTQYLINQLSQEGGAILDRIPQKVYQTIPYKGFFKGLSLHSWNLTPNIATPSLDIQFNNLLNDLSINLLGGYNRNEENPFYLARLTYGKWFPQISVFAGSSKRSFILETPVDTLAIQQFDQHSIGSTVSVPMTWIKGNFSTTIQPYANYTYQILRNPRLEAQNIASSSLNTYALGLNISTIRRRAYQQVDTRWGQAVEVFYTGSLKNTENQLVQIASRLYLPGIGLNHAIKIEANYRRQLLNNQYQFSDRFEYSRGYSKPFNNSFTKLSFNYHFPLAYPDWGFGGITYFKRIRSNIFFDYGKAENPYLENNHFHSLGIELILDNHFFMELPVTIGWRNIYRLNKNEERGYKMEWFISSAFF